jgi:hypothetical protein
VSIKQQLMGGSKKKVLTPAVEEHLKEFVSQRHKGPDQLYYGR